MQDETRRRDARMMEAVAGLAGRSVLASEIDLRLGILPRRAALPRWLGWVVALQRRQGRSDDIQAAQSPLRPEKATH